VNRNSETVVAIIIVAGLPKANDALESFLLKVAVESDFLMESCMYVMKTFTIFLFSK